MAEGRECRSLGIDRKSPRKRRGPELGSLLGRQREGGKMIRQTAMGAAFLILTASASLGQQAHNVKCASGPLEKTYGGSKWLVYGCDDKSSVAIVTAPHNPGAPYVFMFQSSGDGYQLHGDGTGDVGVTESAYDDLSKLSKSDVAGLAKEAAAIGPQPAPVN